ncbi:hypothetical protein BC834DRAFT_974570 [Gloeopeniophorella convolvens]|nr:hypothetical protein BC834DRAFT_974570 [Gloeopeniophorella convolvens]
MPSSQAELDQSTLRRHIIPKEHINIEELAQREFEYHKIWESALEVMLAEPALAERVAAHLHATGKTMDTDSVQDIVPYNGHPIAYLSHFDGLLAAKEPPYSSEERILRGHYAYSALCVFEEYIKGLGLMSSPAARGRINSRVNELHIEYHQSLRGTGGPSDLAARDRGMQLNPMDGTPFGVPSSSSRPRADPITAEMAYEWLSSPAKSGLSRYYFLYNATKERPAQEFGEPAPGMWKLTGISLQQDEVLYNVEMSFPEGCCDISYDEEGLMGLLMDSEIQGEILRPMGGNGRNDTFGFLRSAT